MLLLGQLELLLLGQLELLLLEEQEHFQPLLVLEQAQLEEQEQPLVLMQPLEQESHLQRKWHSYHQHILKK